MLSLLKWCVVAVVAREGYLALGPRRARRKKYYRMALQRSFDTNKPLLVVGDPDAGVINPLFGRDYGCGFVCLDVAGCESCERTIRARAEDALPGLPTDSYVIFVSCTLEYVDDLPQVVRELQRVSGGDLFVATVEPMSLTTLLYPGRQQAITSAPPRSPQTRYIPL